MLQQITAWQYSTTTVHKTYSIVLPGKRHLDSAMSSRVVIENAKTHSLDYLYFPSYSPHIEKSISNRLDRHSLVSLQKTKTMQHRTYSARNEVQGAQGEAHLNHCSQMKTQYILMTKALQTSKSLVFTPQKLLGPRHS